jgi:uncharacterized membrane protein YbhN (UPF0104 family)
MKARLKWIARIVLSAAAIYLVFRKISWRDTWELLSHIDIWWILPALVLFNLSQVVSARRLLYYYRAAGAPLAPRQNLWLYYQGMFYNLFLPGGIGGDGYKVHWLRKAYQVPVRRLVTASVLDRLTGLAVLGLLALALASWLVPGDLTPFPAWVLLPAYGAAAAVALWFVKRYFGRYYPFTGRAAGLSLGVQALQLSAILCLLAAFGRPDHVFAYMLLLLVSSVAAAIPFTIGGAGAREIVFVAGAPLLGVIREEAVAVSLLFFLITVVSSLPPVLVPAPRDVTRGGAR